MGKARPPHKSGEKTGRKPAAARKPAGTTKRPVVRAGAAANGKAKKVEEGSAPVRKSAGSVAPQQARVVPQPEVMIPETPPPLPAPIASFTF